MIQETEVYDSKVVDSLNLQLSDLERENAQLRKIITTLRQQRPTLVGQAHEDVVPTRDIRRELSRFGTDQAVVDFCQKHGIVIPHKEFWYVMNSDGRTAWVDGLEAS